MPFLLSCVWRDAISIPSNPQKSWMHPCVRCVSELLARCVASQPRKLAFRATGSGMIMIFRSGIRGGGLGDPCDHAFDCDWRSEEHTSELQSLMRSSYGVFCLKKQKV